MSNLTIKEEKSKISDNLNIKLIKGYKKDIQYMVHYINKGKKLKTKPIDLSNKNRILNRILSYSNYIDLEKMRVVSSVVEKNECKLLGTKSKKMVNALKLLEMLLFIGFLKILRENSKVHSDDDALELELLKYIVLIYMVITEFENKLAALNRI